MNENKTKVLIKKANNSKQWQCWPMGLFTFCAACVQYACFPLSIVCHRDSAWESGCPTWDLCQVAAIASQEPGTDWSAFVEDTGHTTDTSLPFLSSTVMFSPSAISF